MDGKVTLHITNQLDKKYVLFSALHYFTETVTYALGNRCLKKNETYSNTIHGLLNRGTLNRKIMTAVRDETYQIAAVISPVSGMAKLEISFFKKGIKKRFCSLCFKFVLPEQDPEVELALQN